MTDNVILCACGCGQHVRIAKYPSQHQPRFINTHQHKGENNGNYRGGKEKRACSICGTSFVSWQSQVKVTCSDACYRKWQGLKSKGRGNGKILINCAHCGRELRRFPSQIKDHNFCNRFCQSQHQSKMISGVNNGRWKGGRWKYIQEQSRIRDNYRCVICGFDFATDVHHITPRTKGGTNDFSNLLTLCPNHHRMAHDGIIDLEHLRNYDWQPEHTIDTSIPPASNR